jgi:Arc/MetJ-type ribon-helix-helix transcriptional regulator
MKRRIIFRLPDDTYQQVSLAVKEGKAKTTSELIRTALEQFLKPK